MTTRSENGDIGQIFLVVDYNFVTSYNLTVALFPSSLVHTESSAQQLVKYDIPTSGQRKHDIFSLDTNCLNAKPIYFWWKCTRWFNILVSELQWNQFFVCGKAAHMQPRYSVSSIFSSRREVLRIKNT